MEFQKLNIEQKACTIGMYKARMKSVCIVEELDILQLGISLVLKRFKMQETIVF